jgi:hypothetical protein
VRRLSNCTVEGMNKRPGHVAVTTEVGFCSFCGRPRTLRREEHQLGTLVRTIITCETCHRTLSSTIGVAAAQPAAPEAAPAEPEPATEPAPAAPATAAVAKPNAKRKPAAAAGTSAPKSRKKTS